MTYEGPCKRAKTHRRKWDSYYGGLSWVGVSAKWLRGLDLNQGPLRYEHD